MSQTAEREATDEHSCFPFFYEYSREDASLQQRVIRELRERGVHVWVDIENLIPGSPAWEREIERAIRGAAGIIVLLSPDSNNSEWVRREISFAEQNRKRIFPVLIRGDEVCIINADGTGWQRHTNTSLASYNPSFSPDGGSIVFVSGEGQKTEIYELHLDSGDIEPLTDLGEYVSTPEISPDNRHILFTYRTGDNNRQIWIMNRDGSNPRLLYSASGRDAHDATWSPDGSKILFAFGRGENNQLYIMDSNSHDPQLVNESIDSAVIAAGRSTT